MIIILFTIPYRKLDREYLMDNMIADRSTSTEGSSPSIAQTHFALAGRMGYEQSSFALPNPLLTPYRTVLKSTWLELGL